MIVGAETEAMSSANEPKLEELRRKTDRQLLALVDRQIDAGLWVARIAWETPARSAFITAERAYAEARRLAPLLRNITAAERERLEAKLQELEHVLVECVEGIPVST